MMSESAKRHSKFLSLIFILKCLSKASVITFYYLRIRGGGGGLFGKGGSVILLQIVIW